MKKGDKLLTYLDRALGSQGRTNSSSRLKTLFKTFDSRTGDDILILQYRVRRSDQQVDANASGKLKNKKEVADGKIRRANKTKMNSLVQDINNRANNIVQTGDAAPLDNDASQI